MFLHTWHPQPVILSLNGFSLHWYGLLMAAGALAGYLLVQRIAVRYKVSAEAIFDLVVYTLIFGFIGARLYHVLNEWGYYAARPSDIMKVWNGGLAIHGAMIAGLIVLWRQARRHKLNAWLLADIAVPGLALGQAIGRWGNYFNQELFGGPTGLPWGIPIDLANRPAGFTEAAYFHPTFLYESLGCLLIAGLLVWLHGRRAAAPFNRSGSLTILYFILYSLLRIAMETLRIDDVPMVGALRLPLLTSIIMIGLALLAWIFLIRRRTINPVRP